ncbi:MAG: ABC transporter ATP-binding protein [Parachlamydiaceae bacterium]
MHETNHLEQPVILRAKSIYKAFYTPILVQILNGIDLEIRRGETVAIMGRSGEGKSTLLQVLGTLDTPCQGTLEIDGTLVTRFNKSRIRSEKLAFIFQSFYLLEDYTALDNVLMPARIARKKTSRGSPAYQRACDLLEQVGLADRMHHSAKLLSGGEKQRTAIARALCNNPDIILADEPSGNLDRETAVHIHNLLLDFATSQNKTLIIVTHDPNLAALCSTTYRLHERTLIN